MLFLEGESESSLAGHHPFEAGFGCFGWGGELDDAVGSFLGSRSPLGGLEPDGPECLARGVKLPDEVLCTRRPGVLFAWFTWFTWLIG